MEVVVGSSTTSFPRTIPRNMIEEKRAELVSLIVNTQAKVNQKAECMHCKPEQLQVQLACTVHCHCTHAHSCGWGSAYFAPGDKIFFCFARRPGSFGTIFFPGV